MKKILIVSAMVLAALMLWATPLFAATSQNVTVTLQPRLLAISNTPSTWTINGLTGDSYADVDTVYYSNPLGDTTTPSATVVDGECRFTVTNTSTVNIDYFVNISNFSGGSNNMTNSDTGANGATSYGAYSWYSGMTYSGKVIAKTAASSALATGQSGGTFKWGMEIETQSDAWAGGTPDTATAVISIQAS